MLASGSLPGEVAAFAGPAASLLVADHQSISRIMVMLMAQMSVLAVPLSGFQIMRQSRKALLQPLDRPERRAPRPDPRVQIGLWPAPICVEEPVRAIMRDHDRRNRHGCKPRCILRNLRHLAFVQRCAFGQIVGQPRPVRRIEGEQHDRPARHSPHFAQARSLVGPMGGDVRRSFPCCPIMFGAIAWP